MQPDHRLDSVLRGSGQKSCAQRSMCWDSQSLYLQNLPGDMERIKVPGMEAEAGSLPGET